MTGMHHHPGPMCRLGLVTKSVSSPHKQKQSANIGRACSDSTRVTVQLLPLEVPPLTHLVEPMGGSLAQHPRSSCFPVAVATLITSRESLAQCELVLANEEGFFAK